MRAYLACALLAAAFLTGCATTQVPVARFEGAWLVDGELREQPETSDSSKVVAARGSYRLALVLGGGGMRGYAHIGVLQALENAGLHPDLVVGTSIGAIIGAAYASGTSPGKLWQEADAAHLLSLADVTLQGPGFVKGEALAEWTNELVGNQPIERFPTAYAAVAADIGRALPFVITRGDAGQAARASAAIPGVFLPVRLPGAELIDGGVTSLVPVRAARALGADIVVAVDIYCHGPRYPADSTVSIWLAVSQTQSCLLAQEEMRGADVVLGPPVKRAGLHDAAGRELARRLGYEAAEAALPALRDALARPGRAGVAPPGRGEADPGRL